MLVVYVGVSSVLPITDVARSQFHSQSKLVSCPVGGLAQSRSALAGDAAAGQDSAGSHPREERSSLPLPSPVWPPSQEVQSPRKPGLQVDRGPVVWPPTSPSSKADFVRTRKQLANFHMSLWTQHLLLIVSWCLVSMPPRLRHNCN